MTSHFEDHCPGWSNLYEAAEAAIERLGGTIAQAKEKYGGLRIYVGYPEMNAEMDTLKVARRIDAIVDSAELMASIMCQECGKPGTKQSVAGWLRTLCHGCRLQIPPRTHQIGSGREISADEGGG